MASAEDKNAAGEVREEADGEVRIIYTYNDMRIICLIGNFQILSIHYWINVILELKRDNGERKNAKG